MSQSTWETLKINDLGKENESYKKQRFFVQTLF